MKGAEQALVVGRLADGDTEMLGGETGKAVTGPHGDPTGGQAGDNGWSVRDLQQQEVGGRRPDPDPGQRRQGGGQLLTDGGQMLDSVGGVIGSLGGPGGPGGPGWRRPGC